MLASAVLVGASAAQAFGLDEVARQARELAARPYQAPAALPPSLAGLSYDDYRALRFVPARAHWREAQLPFELQFFHVGRHYNRALALYEVGARGEVRPLKVPREAFSLGDGPPPGGDDAPIAGFRVHYPLNKPGYKDEVIAFLGASYFRALGAGAVYGLSARGLAVDTTGGQPEEFPAFSRVWFERPAPGAKTLTLYALLDGPRAAGAYRFVLRPGTVTQVDVQARLVLRAPVAMLGLAPLTSMFLAGENQRGGADFRPEVHDSDGLLVAAANGEWLWRPLTNPKGTLATSYALRSPRGFGLMQRDRAFASYEDLEAHYERRPSAWVEPQGDWGAGRVELLQFHTPDETHDNIAAYWVPDKAPAPGEELAFAYRLSWSTTAAPHGAPTAQVLQSRRGQGPARAGTPPGTEQFHVDFAGPALKGLGTEAGVHAVASGNANVRDLKVNAYPNAATGGWRVTLEFQRADRSLTTELRALLQRNGQVLSETWSYALAAE